MTVRARRIGALLVAAALGLATATGVGASTGSAGTALVKLLDGALGR